MSIYRGGFVSCTGLTAKKKVVQISGLKIDKGLSDLGKFS